VRCHSHESGNLLPGKASCKGLCVCFASFPRKWESTPRLHSQQNLLLALRIARFASFPRKWESPSRQSLLQGTLCMLRFIPRKWESTPRLHSQQNLLLALRIARFASFPRKWESPSRQSLLQGTLCMLRFIPAACSDRQKQESPPLLSLIHRNISTFVSILNNLST
jgi:hypothetical protein